MANESRLLDIARELAEEGGRLRFAPPVTHVYNPLAYAWEAHAQYLERYGNSPKEVLFLGMNPGPWGMVQTGVPFGEVNAVRDWLGIDAKVGRPEREHPKRPVMGLACTRSEVSGARLWGWARDFFATPERFFERFFIANYCPLAFMESTGRNRTPDKLPASERKPLLEACDRAMRRTVEYLRPGLVVGVGAFAEGRARTALGETGVRIGRILHPSPASPAANRGWSERATHELRELGVELP
jgi:single-strand selective monofunctional uracil DNA glycosylase